MENRKATFADGWVLVIYAIFFILSFLIEPIKSLAKDSNTGKSTYDIVQTLKHQHNIHGKIATDENWKSALYIAFYLNDKFYGMPKQRIRNEETLLELKNTA